MQKIIATRTFSLQSINYKKENGRNYRLLNFGLMGYGDQLGGQAGAEIVPSEFKLELK